nr:pectinesterase-like isoform X2 [Physcomitrium patens]|eukprot:XP_024358730.1 pectinesterase-like isoform X2 [Physcomitrella patens]
MTDRLNTTVELISNSLALTGSMVSYGSDATGWKSPPESRVDQLLELNETSNTDISPGWMGVADRAFLHAPSPQAALDLGELVVTVALDSISPSIQAAVNDAPSWCPTRYVIYIKAGVYNEIVRVPKDKINLMFVGDGSNATIITGNLHVQTPGITTWLSATVAVTGAGFIARGISFENTAGPEQHQAVALRVESDKSAFQDCAILGHQDSLYTHSLRQFFKDCTVAGTVDFIFGNSAAMFQTCNIVVRVGQMNGSSTRLLTAQGRIDPGQKTSLVFQNCSVYGTPEYNALQRAQPTQHRVYLGRPWKQYSRTVFIYTYMSEIVQPQGWSPWKGQFALDTLMDAEYGSYGPGAANVSQRIAWSTQLSFQQAQRFSAQRLVQADSWLPAAAITYLPLV